METLSDTDMVSQFDTNLFGVVRLTQAVLPTFRSQRSGRIINISSIVGVVSFPFAGLYCSSKFALEGLTQALNDEVAQFGIQAVLVQPGGTKTNVMAASTFSSLPTTVEEYKKGVEQTRLHLVGVVNGGVDPAIVGEVILKAITDATPSFRYQCT